MQMLNKFVLKLCITTMWMVLFSVTAFGEVVGVVVADHYKCEMYDRIVVETERGFTNAEVYSGYSDTLEGDIIFGELHSYGFTDIHDENGYDVGRIYVDDYMVSNSEAVEWCFD